MVYSVCKFIVKSYFGEMWNMFTSTKTTSPDVHAKISKLFEMKLYVLSVNICKLIMYENDHTTITVYLL